MSLTLDDVLSSPRLPTIPNIAVRLIEFAEDDNTGVRDIIELVRPDPALTAAIIRASNAASLGAKREVSSLELAVALLGKNIVTSLTLGFSLVPKSRSSPEASAIFDDYWLRSVIQAASAKLLASHDMTSNADELFLIGLLCDLGRLAMLSATQDEYVTACQRAADLACDYHTLELEAFGFTHVDVGVRLATLWNLPTKLISALATHHAWGPDFASHDRSTFEQKVVIFAALAARFLVSSGDGPLLGELNRCGRQFFGFDEDHIRQCFLVLRKEIDRIGPVLQARPEQLPDTDAILWKANNQLLKLTLAAQADIQKATRENEALKRENESLSTVTEDLRNAAARDPLTNLPNIYFLRDYLPREIARCQRNLTTIGVLFCDVDHFKSINDTYGHSTGDRALVVVARALEEAVRQSDVVLRVGGEEFLVVVPAVEPGNLKQIADRIRSHIEALLFEADRGVVRLTVSVGAAFAIPSFPRADCLEIGQRLIDTADKAMYECKRAGRNRVKLVECRFTEGMSTDPPTRAVPLCDIDEIGRHDTVVLE